MDKARYDWYQTKLNKMQHELNLIAYNLQDDDTRGTAEKAWSQTLHGINALRVKIVNLRLKHARYES